MVNVVQAANSEVLLPEVEVAVMLLFGKAEPLVNDQFPEASAVVVPK